MFKLPVFLIIDTGDHYLFLEIELASCCATASNGRRAD